jgi:DnaJ-domain-containing protein 1
MNGPAGPDHVAERAQPPALLLSSTPSLKRQRDQLKRGRKFDIQFSCHETLGVPPNADAAAIRRAWANLAQAHYPDNDGTQKQAVRRNAAY